MADSTAQLAVERWICNEHLTTLFRQPFHKRKLPLAWGALFEFDAVSEDGQVVAVISTSKRFTSGGRPGVGKQTKIERDLAFLHGTECMERLGIFTESCMHEWALGEQRKGRISPNVQLILVEIPVLERDALEVSRFRASNEVNPSRR